MTDTRPELVTLKTLCAELNVDPRQARKKLRAAVREPKTSPNLAKSHKPRQSWKWSERLKRRERSAGCAYGYPKPPDQRRGADCALPRFSPLCDPRCYPRAGISQADTISLNVSF